MILLTNFLPSIFRSLYISEVKVEQFSDKSLPDV